MFLHPLRIGGFFFFKEFVVFVCLFVSYSTAGLMNISSVGSQSQAI